AIRRLLDRPELIEQVGRAARRFVTEEHGASAAIDTIEATLRTEVARGPERVAVERVRELADVTDRMLPLFAEHGTTSVPAAMNDPGVLRTTLWSLLGDGDTGRKRAWRRGRAGVRFVVPRLLTLPVRTWKTALHLVRLDSHFGHVAQRL